MLNEDTGDGELFPALWHEEEVPSGIPADSEITYDESGLPLTRVPDAAALAELGLPHSSHTPHKDLWYLQRRYFAYPHPSYDCLLYTSRCV